MATALLLLALAAPTDAEKGAKLYLEGNYLRAARLFRKASLREPKSVELQLAYLYSLKNSGYAGHVERMLATIKVMPHPKDAAHEALRRYAIADAHRRLAELHRRLWIYYSSDPASELAKQYRRKAGEQAKAADAALRSMRSEQWQPLIDRGLASCDAILGGDSLDEAAMRIDAYARLAEATRKLWEESRERGMAFDPLTSLALLNANATWYGGRVRRSTEDEVATRGLLARCLQAAGRLKPAIEQYTRILDLDPAHADSLMQRTLCYIELDLRMSRLALADLTAYWRLIRPSGRNDEVDRLIQRRREAPEPRKK